LGSAKPDLQSRFKEPGVLAVALVFLIPLMKRSVVEKGAHIGAE
jgi:hypothetical protein